MRINLYPRHVSAWCTWFEYFCWLILSNARYEYPRVASSPSCNLFANSFYYSSTFAKILWLNFKNLLSFCKKVILKKFIMAFWIQLPLRFPLTTHTLESGSSYILALPVIKISHNLYPKLDSKTLHKQQKYL